MFGTDGQRVENNLNARPINTNCLTFVIIFIGANDRLIGLRVANFGPGAGSWMAHFELPNRQSNRRQDKQETSVFMNLVGASVNARDPSRPGN